MPTSTIPVLPLWALFQQHQWRLFILDPTGQHVVDVPEADVESIEIEDGINGGSGVGTLILRRDINNIGRIGTDYKVLVWFWAQSPHAPFGDSPSAAPIPADPWYCGHVVDINQEQLLTHGRVTFQLEGEAMLLQRGIISANLNPGVNGNPTLPAGGSSGFLAFMLDPTNGFAPATFGAPTIPSTMFNLTPTTFDGTGIADALDTIVKQGRDISGLLFTWKVRSLFGMGNQSTGNTLTNSVLIQVDQNPNVLGSPPYFVALLNGADMTEYKVDTKYRDIKNVVSLYGGRDPVTQVQLFAVEDDVTSIANFGPREAKLSNPYILDIGTLQQWGVTWLDTNAYPQAQVTFKMSKPRYDLKAGSWVNIVEAPTPFDVTTGFAGVTKQLRVSNVKVVIKEGRIEQQVTTVSPTPYLDAALYRLGMNTQTQSMQQAGKAQVPNHSQTYIRYGGRPTGLPSTIGFTNGQAVFAGVGVVNFPALIATTYATGLYFVSVDTSGMWHNYGPVTAPPNLPTTEQLVWEFCVIAGTIYA